MEGVSEAELKKHPVTVEVQDEATGQMMEQVVGYRLDTELSIYEQEKPIRCVVEWDGKAGSKKRARLVTGVGQDEMDEEAVVDGLRFRQRVEILLKQLQRRSIGLPLVVERLTCDPLYSRHRTRRNAGSG